MFKCFDKNKFAIRVSKEGAKELVRILTIFDRRFQIFNGNASIGDFYGIGHKCYVILPTQTFCIKYRPKDVSTINLLTFVTYFERKELSL